MKTTEVVVYKGTIEGERMVKALHMLQEKRNGDFQIKEVLSEDLSYITLSENMIMRAVPDGKLTGVFSSILDLKDDPALEHFRQTLSVINRPVKIKIFVTSFCPHCGSVMNELIPLTRLNPNIVIEIIDGGLFPALADKDNIKAAPTVIFDGRFRWTAGFGKDEFIETICADNPKDMSVAAQKKMIESGEAAYLAGLMLNSNTVFPSFYRLLTDEKWPIRLGAMVTAETIAGENIELSEIILDTAWGFFDGSDNAVKGDIIYLTGEIGTMKHVNRLKSVMENGTTLELDEAIQEAVESIMDRHIK